MNNKGRLALWHAHPHSIASMPVSSARVPCSAQSLHQQRQQEVPQVSDDFPERFGCDTILVQERQPLFVLLTVIGEFVTQADWQLAWQWGTPPLEGSPDGLPQDFIVEFRIGRESSRTRSTAPSDWLLGSLM
jgi:hypothetical protein